MVKIIIGFIVFAGLALFLLLKSGGNIDMGGEKHGMETTESSAPASAAASAKSQ